MMPFLWVDKVRKITWRWSPPCQNRSSSLLGAFLGMDVGVLFEDALPHRATLVVDAGPAILGSDVLILNLARDLKQACDDSRVPEDLHVHVRFVQLFELGSAAVQVFEVLLFVVEPTARVDQN